LQLVVEKVSQPRRGKKSEMSQYNSKTPQTFERQLHCVTIIPIQHGLVLLQRASNHKQVNRMKRAFTVVRAVLAISAVWVALAWLVRCVHKADGRMATELPAWVRLPGGVALVVGAVLVLGCGVMLSGCGIGSLPGRERLLPRMFVASGPFRFVRNPMSLGGVILMVGLALAVRSGLALALGGVLFAGLHLFIVCVEEPGLERRFGGSYRDYKQNVPRWIPLMRGWRSNDP
jgi:protein-S-isoprenylcysteine O-methyltransferase Ste14